MRKIRVIQQVLSPRGSGGVSAEYNALLNSSLTKEYEFVPMVVNEIHRGLNIKDFLFYYKTLKRTSPDIIHIRGAAIDCLSAIIAAKIIGKIKILVTVHGMYSDLQYISKIKRWISKNIIENLIYSSADGISCLCKRASERKYFAKYKKKMLPYVYNRIPNYDLSKRQEYRCTLINKLKLESKSIIGLYVGRITKEKGLEVLLDALNTLNISWPNNLVILLAGDGDFKEKFEEHSINQFKNVYVLGDCRNVEELYLASDFFIQPSLHENHSISLLEACAAKLPSIVTDVGGNKETLNNGELGIVISPNNREELESAILQMYNNQIRNKYKLKVENFDFKAFSNEFCDFALDNVYKQILNKG